MRRRLRILPAHRPGVSDPRPPGGVAEYRLHGASMSRNASLMLTSPRWKCCGPSGPSSAGARSYDGHSNRVDGRGRATYGEQLIEQMAQQMRNPRRWVQVGRDAGGTGALLPARAWRRTLAARCCRGPTGHGGGEPRSPGVARARRRKKATGLQSRAGAQTLPAIVETDANAAV